MFINVSVDYQAILYYLYFAFKTHIFLRLKK